MKLISSVGNNTVMIQEVVRSIHKSYQSMPHYITARIYCPVKPNFNFGASKSFQTLFVIHVLICLYIYSLPVEHSVIEIHHGDFLYFSFHFKKAQRKQKAALTQYTVLVFIKGAIGPNY